VQAVVLAVQPARQVVQLALSQALAGTGMATRTPRSPMEMTSRFARVLRAHVQSIAPPIVVAVLRGTDARSGAAISGCKRRAVGSDVDASFSAMPTGVYAHA